MALFGLGQIGCSPNELAQNSPDGSTCVQNINSANQIFNSKLKSLVNELNNNVSDGRFIFIDSYGIFQDIISRPSSFGNEFPFYIFWLNFIVLSIYNNLLQCPSRLRKQGLNGWSSLVNFRFEGHKCRVLRCGEEQRANYMSASSRSMPKQGWVSLLGCFSSNWERQYYCGE